VEVRETRGLVIPQQKSSERMGSRVVLRRRRVQVLCSDRDKGQLGDDITVGRKAVRLFSDNTNISFQSNRRINREPDLTSASIKRGNSLLVTDGTEGPHWTPWGEETAHGDSSHTTPHFARPDLPLLPEDEFARGPFSSATRLTVRCKALGDRAGVKRCTPHCFRDTFACDMLAKGAVGV